MKEINLTAEEIEYLEVLLDSHKEELLKKQKKMPPLPFASAIRNTENILNALDTAELF